MGEAEKSNDAPKSQDENYRLPDVSTLQKASELKLLDEDGKEITFKSLFSSSGERSETRHLIVFIRHFFCGSCEQYVHALSQDLPPSVLSGITSPTNLIIVGCGQPAAVPGYKTRTMGALRERGEREFPIYCDPGQKLYALLGMVSNLGQGEGKPGYITVGVVGNVLRSLGNVVMVCTPALPFLPSDAWTATMSVDRFITGTNVKGNFSQARLD